MYYCHVINRHNNNPSYFTCTNIVHTHTHTTTCTCTPPLQATHVRVGTVDRIRAQVSPENPVSLVIPVDSRGSAEIGQWEREVDILRDVERDTEDISPASKQDEVLQSCGGDIISR